MSPRMPDGMVGDHKAVAVAMHVQAADGVFAAEARATNGRDRTSTRSPRSINLSSALSSSSRDVTLAPSSRTSCLNVARACGNRAI